MLAAGSGRPPSVPKAPEGRGVPDGPLARVGSGPAATAPSPFLGVVGGGHPPGTGAPAVGARVRTRRRRRHPGRLRGRTTAWSVAPAEVASCRLGVGPGPAGRP
jgi:hypothetical protein